MSAHTPGPWHFTEPHDEMIRVTSNGTDHGKGARTVVVLHAFHLSLIEEERANAHLIAAAPDLLAALEAFTRNLQRGPWGDDGPPVTHPDAQRFADARAAIAKARGE